MAIISDKGLSLPKKKVKKTNKGAKQEYKCTTCKDTKTLKIKDVEVKCGCQVKKEMSSWLHPSLKILARRNPSATTFNKKSLEWLRAPTLIVFKKVPSRYFYSQTLKYLLATYYWDFMSTSSYYLITGDDYTEAYVVGEHTKYHEAVNLFLKLGVDNFNKTLETTLYTLITKRESLGLKTWVFVDPHISDSAFVNLYGEALFKYLEDSDSYDYLITNVDNKIKAIKGRDYAS